MPTRVNGILLIYHHPLTLDASTILEHVDAFRRHSRFRVWSVNTALGFPDHLWRLNFRIVVLHYSLFGCYPFFLSACFESYLEKTQSYKIAFFQDEYQYCRARVEFINRARIECTYSLLAPAFHGDVYGKCAGARVVHTIPGYVSDQLVAIGRKLAKRDAQRGRDIGYRGRKLPPHMGRGAQEKVQIAVGVLERVRGLPLRVDIEIAEDKRIYGRKWFEFLADCKGVLGVEAGVSIFDLDGDATRECEKLLAAEPTISIEELSTRLLWRWENNIPYRTISPRHFEAAALRVCQILYEGDYSGILRPGVHYIPLRKDFGNFDEAMRLFGNEAVRCRVTERAYEDLIASGRYSYRGFIEAFDRDLLARGFTPVVDRRTAAVASALLGGHAITRIARARLKTTLDRPFAGRRIVKRLLKPALGRYGRWREALWPEDGWT